MGMVHDITDAEIASLTQSILVRYGIDFTCYEPKSLKRRIIRILNLFNLASSHELWVKFLRDHDFIHSFMNEISVGMTSMFRDPVLWQSIRERLRTEYRSKLSISIWHAGCSTGEEVYSFGILLKENQMMARTKALATDFNKNAIEEAKQGIYHKIKMIENESNYREFNPSGSFEQYYNSDGKHAAMHKELIRHTTFSYQNLITDPFQSGFDVIFCRNVMIYFDGQAKTKLLKKFYDALNPGGYFIIGFFDTMSHMIDNDKFRLVDDQAKIFQKV